MAAAPPPGMIPGHVPAAPQPAMTPSYAPPPGYDPAAAAAYAAAGYPPYAAPPPGYQMYAGAAPAPADPAAELQSARAEIAALKAENAALKAENAALKAGQGPGAPPAGPPALVPPPNLAWPPPAYGAPPGYAASPYAPPGYAAPPGYPGYGAPAAPKLAPATLPMNNENKRGPKGANLAVFCIPNNYGDQQVLDLCAPHGNVIFCQVAMHRETGQSRGYAFVSYETVEHANAAIASLHNMTVEGRALRVELARADKEAAKPY